MGRVFVLVGGCSAWHGSLWGAVSSVFVVSPFYEACRDPTETARAGTVEC